VRILSESAVGAGARRIEALTGEGARGYLATQDERVKTLANTLKVAPGDVLSRVEGLVEERRRLERELTEARRKLALGGGSAQTMADGGPEQVAGVGFVGKVVEGVAARELKPLADEGKKQVGSGVVVFVGTDEGKASVVVGVTDDLTQRFNAVELVRAASAAIGGKGGGGRPDMAQAGGPEAARADEALAAVRAAMEAA